jgi:hypothetical protein
MSGIMLGVAGAAAAAGSGGGGGGGSDPNFATVEALLGFEGADASTTFTDESPDTRTFTPSGNAQIDTAQFKFGTASGLFDGTGDFLTQSNDAAFSLVSGDVTIEAWVRISATGKLHCIASKRPSVGAAEWDLFINASQQIQFLTYASGSAIGNAVGSTAISTGVWYHVAATREGSTMRVFLDGVLDGSATQTGTVQSSTQAFLVGRSAFNTTRDFQGWMDEFRFTSGVARYTTSFTPPTAAFPRS